MAENINIAGRLHSTATGNVVAGANEIYDDTKGKKQSVVNQETDAALNDRYPKSQTYNKTEINNLITTPNQEYVTVTATDQTTAATDVLPATGDADKVYRVGNWDGTQYDETCYSEYAWNGSAYVHLSTKTQVGEVFDISAYHATGGELAKYADLAAALDSNNGGGVPQSLQKGGMSVKFVQSSDNKYYQSRLMAQSFTTDVTQWQGVDKEIIDGSSNIPDVNAALKSMMGVYSEIKDFTVKNYAIKADGTFSGSASHKHAVIPVTTGEVFYLVGESDTVRAAFATSDEATSGNSVPVVSGTEIMPMPVIGQYYKFVIPEGCSYFLFNAQGSYNTRCFKHYDSLKEGTDKYTDDAPIPNSNNLVKSSGVFNATMVSQETISVPEFIRTSFFKNGTELTFLSGYIKANLAVGEIIDLTPQSTTSNSTYCIVDCTENDYFYVDGVYGGNASRVYCFIDADNKVLSVAAPNVVPAKQYYGLVKAPKYSSKAIFQRNNTYGSVYTTYPSTKIDIKNCPSPGSSSIYIDSDGYHVGSFVVFRNNESTVISPENEGTVLTPSTNGYVVYNYTTNTVRFEQYSSHIGLDDYVLEFYYINENVYFGGGLSDRYNSIGAKKTSHIFDLYMAVDASFTNDSITLSYCRGLINNNIVLHELKVDGVRTKQTFTFTENGYLVYNAKTFSARFSTSYSDITQDEFIWIYYLKGKIKGGLLFQDYLDYRNSLQVDSPNIIFKRAQQLATIKWYAKNPVASTSSTTGIAVGEHTGLPYTSCMEVDKFVGWDVSIRTFMTAANNPYSLLYTEDLSRNISGYGFTYHGGRATIGGYMGIVCNIFALYPINLPIPYDTGNWNYLRRTGVFKKLDVQDFKYSEIGDLVWEQGHGNIIIDVEKDDDGNVTRVKWAESQQDFPVIRNWSITQANDRLERAGGIIYRVVGINKYLFYERSPYVATLGESIETITYNNDICTFAGDYAAFRKGQTIYLNYNLAEVGSWDSIELYKNDTLVETLSIDTSSHRIDLTSLNLDYGKYKARMKHETDYSDYTYFEILDTTVSLSYDGSKMVVNFSSANGNPTYLRLCKPSGGPVCIVPLTEENVRNGVVEFDPFFYINRQGYNYPHGGTYLKVYFSGEYGDVTNEPILTNL